MRWLVFAALAGCSYRPTAIAGDGGSGDSATDTSSDGAIDALRVTQRRLVFGNPTGTLPSTNVPILIALDNTKIDYADVTDPARDLRFHDDVTAADLPFEIERWDPTGESIVWVRVPVVPAATTASIDMFYGADAAGTATPAAVWSGYDAVLHMETFASSTGTHDGTAINVAASAGQLGNAATFAGTGDERITFANAGELFDGWGAFTLELWLYADYTDGTAIVGEPRIMDKGTPLNLGRLFTGGTPTITYQVDMHFSGNNNEFVNTTVAPMTWTYLAYVFDGTNKLRLYKNGVQVGQGNLTGATNVLLTSTQAFLLGDATNPIKGGIDELRIIQAAYTDDDMVVQNLSMTRQLVTFEDP